MKKRTIASIILLILIAGCSLFGITSPPKTEIDYPGDFLSGGGGFSTTSCGRFICGNDTYSGSGNFSGKPWWFIESTLSRNFHNNTHSWNQTRTLSNGSVTYLWPDWYASGDAITESNLKDTYTQSLWGVNATWANSTSVTDEGSELSMASVMNWSNTTFRYWINLLDVCADKNSGHISEGPWLTSWVCSQKSGNITKNDENSASDATARLALTAFMGCKNPMWDDATKQLACDRAVNITRASVAEEWVTSNRNSTVNTSANITQWHLAGAAQAWGPGALTQVGQQAFFAYHPPDTMMYLAAYAYTHDPKYSSAARNETHQFLFVVGFRNGGNTSAYFNYTTGGAHYYLNCTTGTSYCRPQTQSGSSQMDDSDAPRVWEMCPNVEYANITYTTFGEDIPWEFIALQRYCDAWTERVGPTLAVTSGGANFGNLTSACYRIKNDSTCDSTGIIGLNSFKEAGWVSFIVARKNNASFYSSFASGSLSTYNNISDTYPGQTGFGVYGGVRYLTSIRANTGYYDFLFRNQTFNYTGYTTGFGSGSDAPPPEYNITITSPQLNDTDILSGESIRFNVSINTSVGDVQTAKVTILWANGTRTNHTLTRLTR